MENRFCNISAICSYNMQHFPGSVLKNFFEKNFLYYFQKILLWKGFLYFQKKNLFQFSGTFVLNLFSAFRYFLLYISSLLIFFYYIANFFQTCHIFIKKIFIFYHYQNIFYIKKISFILYLSFLDMHKGLISLLSL